ncbi:MAG: cytochrome C [Acidobacteria bacterium]|nr:cytochrome C [Acidobacteriota bacterium]
MENLIKIISKPDNVAIVIMMVMVVFFTVVAFYLAIRNDWAKLKPTDRQDGQSVSAEAEVVNPEEKIHVWPYLARKEFLVAIVVIVLLLGWSIVLDAPLEEEANPALTPNPAKAPWYFVGLQEMLVYFDPWIAGVVLPGLIIVGLMAIPYLDRNPRGSGYYSFAERKWEIIVFCFGFWLWIGLIIIGTFMRGPGWMWFWPWETWDPQRMITAQNVDLSEFFGISSRSLLGSLIGAVAVLGYFALGMILPYRHWWKTKGEALERLGAVRYTIIMLLLLMMVGLPIKMALRLTMNLKYFWVTPWFNV